MLARQLIHRIGVLLTVAALLPLHGAEAGGPYMRGPMIGHVSPTTAVIWVYTKNRPGVRVYYRATSAPVASARFVDMDSSRAGAGRARG